MLMPTLNESFDLNRLLYKLFLWNGTDQVTRLSTIDEFENARPGIYYKILACGLAKKDIQ